MTNIDRELAVLKLAAPGMSRLDVDDISALADIATESDLTLAELLLRRATVFVGGQR